MATYRRQQRMTVVVIVVSLFLIIGLVVGVALVVNANKRKPQEAVAVTYDSYQPAWESAMAKAGVEATFPIEPVNLVDVQASGMQDFSATFTAEEITALLVMYPFEHEMNGGQVSLQRSAVSFPVAGRGVFDGYLVYGSTSYSAHTEAPVTYENGDVTIDAGDASLTVEGFSVGGDKRTQALKLVGDYLSALLAAAPRLTITSAEIVEDGVMVEGTCPVRLEHPIPVEAQ